MRNHVAPGLMIGLMIVCTGTLFAAQSGTPPKKEDPSKPITLSGCVSRDTAAPNQFTLSDETGAPTYHLTGMDVRQYFGQRVELVGGVPSRRKLSIVGGLQPSANVAAQAGDMDPSRAATAAAGGSAGPGTVQLPEFKVKSVRPASGNCPG
jgi:hypothetical protein